jgi:4-amino-4-deoxy-L-arabinose transferase-like glycosyltransferase
MGETAFYIMPVILSLILLILVERATFTLFGVKEQSIISAMILSLLPPFLSISSYPNSHLPQIILLVLAYYAFKHAENGLAICSVLLATSIRVESIFMFLVFASDSYHFDKVMYLKGKSMAIWFIIIFMVWSPLLFLIGHSGSDLSLFPNLNLVLLSIICVGILPVTYIFFGRWFNLNLLMASIILFLPFIFTTSGQPRMLIMPLLFFIWYIITLPKLSTQYLFLPMTLLSLVLIASYITYPNMEETIKKYNLPKDIELGDYSIFFKEFGSDNPNCIQVSQMVIDYHKSDLIPQIKLLEVDCIQSTARLS